MEYSDPVGLALDPLRGYVELALFPLISMLDNGRFVGKCIGATGDGELS